MNCEKMFDVVETHTFGEGTRTIISGVPVLKGATIAEKMQDFQSNYDWIRTAVFCEPRGGHEGASGAVLLAPCSPEADLGVFYLDYIGDMPMCGHSTIGVTTAAIETGLVKAVEPFTTLRLDTPAGIVTATAEVREGKVLSVTFKNIPTFLYKTKKLYFEEYGDVEVDVAYGGNAFVIVPAEAFGLVLGTGIKERIFTLSKMVLDKANQEIGFQHPEKSFIRGITQIHWYSKPMQYEDANSRSANVVLPGSIDRSPCGTGTSARVTALFTKGEIGLNEPFIQESLTGGRYVANVVERTKVGDFDACVVTIQGQAWISGYHKYVLDASDPLRHGFLTT